jgi:uncharacterized membrane protein (UPF0182 family)
MSFFDERYRPNEHEDLGPPPPVFRIAQRRLRFFGSLTRWLAVLVLLVLLFVVLNILKSIYADWLWFDSLGYRSVFSKTIVTRIWLFFAGAGVFLALFLGNVFVARRLAPAAEEGGLIGSADRVAVRRVVLVGLMATALFLAVIFGSTAAGQWDSVLRFMNSQSFGLEDPAFHKDISFYVFKLPTLHFIQGWATAAVIVTTLFVAGLYALRFVLSGFAAQVTTPIKAHLSLLVVAVVGLFVWRYWLGIFDLTYSTRGAVFGAGFTDLNAQLWAIRILMGIGSMVALLILVNIFFRRGLFGWGVLTPAAGAGVWVVMAIALGIVWPAMQQRFEVEPNELVKESPYIQRNIDATRQAYGLDNIEVRDFAANPRVTAEELAADPQTIENIRLWDHRPLLDTLNEGQSLRQLYVFLHVDVDRYTVDGQYRQVMLAGRELDPERSQTEAKTWVNRRLQFTHGYGLAMSPVNEVVQEGLPRLFVKDIPLVGSPEVTQPSIYYGELPDHYVIVTTKEQEFDYKGSRGENVYTTFEGEGGVRLNSFLRRLVYAWEFNDFNIVISDSLTDESRILYRRNIQDRVSTIAPFLRLDDDPYLVVADGQLFWIQDAYTVSEGYPYSRPSGDFNYIRNSVKVVINAYDGEVTFYLWDESDAIAQTWKKIFPKLFTPMSEMPASLQSHVRYPQDLFSVQMDLYRAYHMEEARVFYNREDLWEIPQETFMGQQQPIEPYYVIMRLPGETREEFIQIMPLVPATKKNAIAWLAARSDGDNYGKLLLFRFLPGELIPGPAQVEARIDQDTRISEQLTLWDQAGSEVIRGNLLMIPIGNSSLYVEPIYLQAENVRFPELKRVVVANGNSIAMEPTLSQAIDVVMGQAEPTLPEPAAAAAEEEEGAEVSPTPGPELTPTPTPEATPTAAPEAAPSPLPTDIAALTLEAQAAFERAQELLRQGDFAGYGQEIDRLEELLERLVELTGE